MWRRGQRPVPAGAVARVSGRPEFGLDIREAAEEFSRYLRSVILHPFPARLPAGAHNAFVAAVVEEAGWDPRGYVIDYERLNIRARRR